jgi:hypothetical protein
LVFSSINSVKVTKVLLNTTGEVDLFRDRCSNIMAPRPVLFFYTCSAK